MQFKKRQLNGLINIRIYKLYFKEYNSSKKFQNRLENVVVFKCTYSTSTTYIMNSYVVYVTIYLER